uniref:G-protein coupled receptors family 1 profile domain-containing protein n=1 Tax=Accipiter nisus TaxID=211598 RepID=A0A8B9N110_9AVES
MAPSDMLIFLSLPLDLYCLWKYKPYIFGDFLCKFFIYLSETYTYCTILHITIVSVERYFRHLLSPESQSDHHQVPGEMAHPGAVGLLPPDRQPHPLPLWCGTPQRQPVPEEPGVQVIKHVARMGLLEMMTWVSTIYFFLPVLCLILLYGLIGRKCWRSGQRLPGSLVVLAFVLCWLPFHVGQILFAQSEIILYDLTHYFNLIAMLLFYLGASINHILYNIVLHKYRKAMSKILHHKRTRRCRSQNRSEKGSSHTAWSPG